MRALAFALAVAACGSDDPAGAFCGDGAGDPGEACDDGNTADGDGCSRSCTLEDIGQITATWAFKDFPSTPTGCPAGFDTARVVAQPLDANDMPAGAPRVDLYSCEAGTGAAHHPAARYRTWVEVTTADGGSVYAQSLSAILDLTANDQMIAVTILNNGGYFSIAWQLRGKSSNQLVSCDQVAGLSGVQTLAMLSTGGQASVDKFNCEAHFGVTGGFRAGSYSVATQAFQTGVGSLGAGPTLTNQVVGERNAITALGSVEILIDSL